MKYLKRAKSQKEFEQLCHPHYANGVQTVTYKRSDKEYNDLVASYENNPEDSNYVYPKRMLHSSKRKVYKCNMTWNYELYNGYHAIRVKINSFTPSTPSLNNFVLCLEMERRRHGAKRTKTLNSRMLFNLYNKTFSVSDTSVNNYYKVNPVLRREYIFYICPRHRKLLNAKLHTEANSNIHAYNEYFLNIKVRPTLVHKDSFQDNTLNYQQFDSNIWHQDYMFLHLQLDKFINFK